MVVLATIVSAIHCDQWFQCTGLVQIMLMKTLTNQNECLFCTEPHLFQKPNIVNHSTLFLSFLLM